MGKREIVKTVLSFGTSFAVSGLVTMMIKANAVPSSFKEKAYLAVGGFVLSDMVGSKAADHVEECVDKFFDTWDGLKKPADSKYVETEKIDSTGMMNDILESLEEEK